MRSLCQDVRLDEDALEHIVQVANGDCRSVMNALELAVLTTPMAADGSIHVYGKLFGKALAGIKDDSGAMIFCDCFDPELVSINGIYILSDRIADAQRMKRVAVSLNSNRIEVQSL